MYQYLHTSMPSPSPRTAHYSPFLHLAILSVATAFSDDPVIANKDTRKKFADLCKSRIEDELGAPSLSAIQGLGLLGSYHSGLGQQTLGFVYFGELGGLPRFLTAVEQSMVLIQTSSVRYEFAYQSSSLANSTYRR